MGDTVVNTVMGALSSLSLQEFGLLWGFEDSVNGIKNNFKQINAVLEDSEKRNQNNAVELWLQRLRSASLKIENVLEEISTEAKLQSLREERGVFGCWSMISAFFTSNQFVSDEISTEPLLQRIREERGIFRCWAMVSAFFNSNQLVFRLRIAHKVKDINKTLDDIKNGPSINSSSVIDMGVNREMPVRETSSDKPIRVFERAHEVDSVIEQICIQERVDQYFDGGIRVYGIWGMAGVGKTALAQLIYNHQRVNRYFNFQCWVHVSQNFEVKTIIKIILKFLGRSSEAAQLDTLETLQSFLKNQLRVKRFLLILDDVWIEEDERHKWDDLRKALSCGKEGSIVVMTTRSWTTSRMMAKFSEMQHKMETLTPDDSWLLFTTLAIAQGRDADGMILPEPIERSLVKECKGLPLAVEALGNFMRLKSSAREDVQSNIHMFQQVQHEIVLPHLKLSYDNLLPHLKRCFSYCCLFPKDTIMVKDEVIHLWMSNGFIPPRGNMDLYLLGKEIFKCLIRRSFFLVHESENDTYKIHDLMHDMAKDMIEDDCLVMDPACTDVKIQNEKIHLRSSHPEFVFSHEQLRNLTQLRSILTLVKKHKFNRVGLRINRNYIPVSQIFKHMYLRVLYLPHTGLTTLPELICNLKLLKYLNLSESNIEVLPESIIYLQNLRVLVLYHCGNLRKLPKDLRYMRRLQLLDIRLCNPSLRDLLNGINRPTNLRILS